MNKKLRNNKWIGPYEVIQVYNNNNVDILRRSKPYRVHASRLKHSEHQYKQSNSDIKQKSHEVKTNTNSTHTSHIQHNIISDRLSDKLHTPPLPIQSLTKHHTSNRGRHTEKPITYKQSRTYNKSNL
jgi:hypothetical protein